jgi:hypothetical protein
MAVYTETLNLDGNLGAEAKRAADQVAVLEKGLASAEAALVRASALGDVKGFQKATANVEAYQAAIDAVPPSLIEAREEAVSMGEALAKAGEVALAGAKAIGAAVVAVVASMGALAIAGMKLALEAADAKGDMMLLFSTLTGGAVSGDEAVAMFDRLGDATGRTREELAATAKAFAPFAQSAAELEVFTRAGLSAEAMAKGGGAAFEEMTRKIQAAAQAGKAFKLGAEGLAQFAKMGLRADDVAARLGMSAADMAKQLEAGTIDAKRFGDALNTALVEKGAGPVADAAMDLGNMWAKAKESVGKFFEDINIEPFLKEVKALFGILDQANPSGRALKAGIGGAFQAMFDVATKVVPMVKRFFLDLIIYGLKAYIALKPIPAMIQEFADSAEGAAVIDYLKKGLASLAIAAGVVVAVVGVLIATLVATVGVLAGVGAAVAVFVSEAISTLAGWAMTAQTAALDFIAGLVAGIQAGAAQVVGAVKGLASQATTAFKGALGIASPSKVMMEMGGYMGDGVAMGLDDSGGDVASSATGLATTAVDAVASAPAPGAPTGGVGAGLTVYIEPGAIVIQGGASASVVDLTEQAIAQIFERIASQQAVMG